MKIKDICGKTSRTERTVRFYVEKGLILPAPRYMNDRTYYEYSDGDVSDLLMIAALRKALFPVESILEMKKHPGKTDIIFMEHYIEQPDKMQKMHKRFQRCSNR